MMEELSTYWRFWLFWVLAFLSFPIAGLLATFIGLVTTAGRAVILLSGLALYFVFRSSQGKKL